MVTRSGGCVERWKQPKMFPQMLLTEVLLISDELNTHNIKNDCVNISLPRPLP